MPDLVTHFTVAYLLKRPNRWAQFRVPFYLGAILPDLLSRPVYILFPKAYPVVYSFHTPAMVVLFSLLLAEFFEPSLRRGVRLNLLLGVGTHFGLDLFQRSVSGSYKWLYPLQFETFDFGFFWPDESVRLVPLWIIILAAAEFYAWWRERKNRRPGFRSG